MLFSSSLVDHHSRPVVYRIEEIFEKTIYKAEALASKLGQMLKKTQLSWFWPKKMMWTKTTRNVKN